MEYSEIDRNKRGSEIRRSNLRSNGDIAQKKKMYQKMRQLKEELHRELLNDILFIRAFKKYFKWEPRTKQKRFSNKS